MGDRRAEDGHNVVTYVLVYGAAIFIDNAIYLSKIAVEKDMGVF